MSIDCAFYGSLGRDPEQKTSQNGRTYLRLNIRVGMGDAAQWVSVLAFNDVDILAARLRKDSRVYIEGTVSASGWLDKDNQARANLQVLTSHCIETHRIGQNRPPRDGGQRTSTGPRAVTKPELQSSAGF